MHLTPSVSADLKENGGLLNRRLQHLESLMSRRLVETILRERVRRV